MARTVAERFQRFVEPEPNTGCHLWIGSTNHDGYGLFSVTENGRERIERAHRMAWVLEYGEIPLGAFVLHRCDNPSCVCIDHLFCGTNADNMNDMAKKWRGNKSRLGRPFGVTAVDGGYSATVKMNGKAIYLGCFSDPEEAGRVATEYKNKARQAEPKEGEGGR